jgi:L-fucose isomerase-like protein
MQKLSVRIGVASLASPMEVGADRAPAALADLAALLRRNGIHAVTSRTPVDSADAAAAAGRLFAKQQVDALCLAVASWFEDYLVLDLIEECDVPVLLWPQPGMETGALCGTQQLTCYLRQLEKPYASVFGSLEDRQALDRALPFLKSSALGRRLRRSRIGLAGARVGGMTEASANEMALKKALGPRIVIVDMPELLERARQADRSAAKEIWKRLKSAAARVEVPERDGLAAAGMYLAIKEVVRKEGLSALAFGCYPHWMGRACVAASLLADEGIPVACEGDVNGAVGMLMLSLLTNHPTHNTDWLEPLPDGSVVFTHCGSGSYSLAERREDITLAPVRLMSQGVCSLFPARPGPVTLVNLMPHGAGYRMAVMEGEALATELIFPGNPLRVRFERPVEQIIEWISDEGISHHWMAGHGFVRRELQHLARIAGDDLCYLSL